MRDDGGFEHGAAAYPELDAQAVGILFAAFIACFDFDELAFPEQKVSQKAIGSQIVGPAFQLYRADEEPGAPEAFGNGVKILGNCAAMAGFPTFHSIRAAAFFEDLIFYCSQGNDSAAAAEGPVRGGVSFPRGKGEQNGCPYKQEKQSFHNMKFTA
jgi:hypothetical protein